MLYSYCVGNDKLTHQLNLNSIIKCKQKHNTTYILRKFDPLLFPNKIDISYANFIVYPIVIG